MFSPEKYRSVVWQKGGRAFPGLDCFGIVNEIRRDLGLVSWPDFAGVTKDDNGLDREARGLMADLTRCEPVPGAGIACYCGSVVIRRRIMCMCWFSTEMPPRPGPGKRWHTISVIRQQTATVTPAASAACPRRSTRSGCGERQKSAAPER